MTHYASDDLRYVFHESHVEDPTTFRRVVVIDPEDREAVERLHSLNRLELLQHPADTLQAALREFANPTPAKPDEPLGLGAVVEDAEGRRFIRYDQGNGWHWLDGTASRQWNVVAAVRVLSEGVTE